MRLYGSLNNRLMEATATELTPTVGMGATIYLWSDRYAATVTKVSASGKTIWLIEDSWDINAENREGLGGGYGSNFRPNPNGRTHKATLRANGTWKTTGSHNGVTLGTRAAYRDPHF